MTSHKKNQYNIEQNSHTKKPQSRKGKIAPYLIALASILPLSSCNDTSQKDVYEQWEKTENLKNAYNSTYESIESIKKQIRELDKKLKNPRLNKEEKRELIKQKIGLNEILDDLHEDKKKYKDQWDEAVSNYLESKKKSEENGNGQHSTEPNEEDGRLPSQDFPI